MFKKSAPVLLLGGVMLAVSCASMAQDKGKGAGKGGTSVVPTVAGSGNVSIGSLIERYTPVAGSETNATSLVNGLRDGSEITLTGKITERVVNGCEKIEYRPVLIPRIDPVSKQVTGMVQAFNPDGTPKMQRITSRYDCDVSRDITETFTPPTGNMGLGNVDIALALTDAVLTHQNVTKPAAPGQLRDALIGENGILQLRAKGMGWGQVASFHGYELK